MRPNSVPFRLLWVLVGVLLCRPAGAQTAYQVVTDFSQTGVVGAATPYAVVIQGSDGDFYGTTRSGGDSAWGTVFKLTAAGAVTVLHEFTTPAGGAYPNGELVEASDGNLYGSTYAGGTGSGIIFRITPQGTFTLLRTLDDTNDGGNIEGPLVQASDGNLYGTAKHGGSNSNGTVFRITTAGVLTLLHSFDPGNGDGALPHAGLTIGSDGRLWGSTASGGVNGAGTLFAITTTGTFTKLYDMTGAGGSHVNGELVQGTDGAFYGTTYEGGANNAGAAFKFNPAGAGTYTRLFSFATTGSIGAHPDAGLIQGTDGAFYGTASQGSTNGYGSVFRMTSAGAMTRLYSFVGSGYGSGYEGYYPYSRLIEPTPGTFYGTTTDSPDNPIDGQPGKGVVFRLTLPSLAVSDVTVTEGDSGSVNAVFTVTSTKGTGTVTGANTTVSWATADETANAGADYTASSGTLTFTAATSQQTVTVPVLGDALDEYDETFSVNLSGVAIGSIGDASGVGTITDDDVAPPSITIADVIVVEGNAPVDAVFTVTLSAASGVDVTVDWATALIGGATSGVDYTAASGTVTIPAGLTTGTFSVTVTGDLLDEGPEYFYVDISNPSGATIADGQARSQISDDDPAPVIAFSSLDPINTEGDTGTTAQSFTVTLTGATERTVDVTLATGTSGTATSGTDYAAKSGSIRFTPGQTSKVVKILITSDLIDEPRETYFVNLSSPLNGTIGDGQAMGTIVDNDSTPGGSPDLTIGNATPVLEGNTGTVNATFTVSLSAPAVTAVSFTYGTGLGGTATSGVDYVGFTLKTATIAVGQTTKTITVAVNGDLVDEPTTETFFVNITSASNANITDSQGQGTITDDEP